MPLSQVGGSTDERAMRGHVGNTGNGTQELRAEDPVFGEESEL